MSHQDARNLCRVANDFYERALKTEGDHRRELLTQAAKALDRTRQLDPHAEVPYVSSATKQPTSMTLDQFSALLLYTQSFQDLHSIETWQSVYANSSWLFLPLSTLKVKRYRDQAYTLTLDAITKAIRYDPHQPMYFTQLARIHLARGLKKEAHDALQGALKLDPDYLDAHSMLATL